MSELTDPPATARAVFGNRLALAERYAEVLATHGIARGVIGPRERDRLWERHLLNSALLADLLPAGARAVDVGSGAGLPGVPIAIRRPDVRMDLVEPMQRRIDFLREVVAVLGLGEQVRVVRGRAEEPQVAAAVGGADWVLARAVAPLDRLVRWCLPLLAPGGSLLALKGASAADEVAEHGAALRRAGAGSVTVQQLGAGLVSEPTWVVAVERGRNPKATRGRR